MVVMLQERGGGGKKEDGEPREGTQRFPEISKLFQMWKPRFIEVNLTKVSLLVMARLDIPISLDSKHIF